MQSGEPEVLRQLYPTDLWLEITVNDFLLPHELQRSEQLVREASNEGRAEPHKAVCFDHLVEVDAKHLGNNAKMASEVEMLQNSDHMMFVLGILPSKNVYVSHCFGTSGPRIWNLRFTQLTRFSNIFTSTWA